MELDKERGKLEDMINNLKVRFDKNLLDETYSKALEIYMVDKEMGYKYVTILNRYWGDKRLDDRK